MHLLPTEHGTRTRYFLASWEDFDRAVRVLVSCLPRGATCLLAVPRGGLVLGAALAHATGLPLFTDAAKVPATLVHGAVLVDDIADSGTTIATMRAALRAPDVPALCWFRRQDCGVPAIGAALAKPHDWIVFPWEQAHAARADRASYLRAHNEAPDAAG